MQIVLNFKCDNAVLPIAHKYQVQGLIYSMLSSSRAYCDFIHNEGYALGEKKFKLFTFGNLYGKYIIENKHIVFLNEFSLEIRSPNSEFINAIIQYASSNRQCVLCGNDIYLKNFFVKNKVIFENEIEIKTFSPITTYKTLDNGKTLYYPPNESEFYDSIIKNAVNKLLSYGISAGESDIELTPMCEFTEKNKTVTLYKDTYINAWSGKFVLKASPQILSFLYDTGLGSKNSQGFGMFEII